MVGVAAMGAGLLRMKFLAWASYAAAVVPQEVVSLTVGGALLGVVFRMFLYLKKDVLDEQSRKLSEAVRTEREQRERIQGLEKELWAKERRLWRLEQALSRAGFSLPDEEDL